jgi:aspartate aminotransferase-like enzyme
LGPTWTEGWFGRPRPNLRLPGPVEIPAEVSRAAGRPMINHLGPEFAALLARVTAGLRHVFGTDADVLGFPSSGSGVMEAAIVNCFSPGDRVIAIVNGVFSERWAAMADAFGLRVTRLDVEWGRAVDPDAVARALGQLPDAAGVLVTHNETSTGVTCDLEAIARAARGESDDVLVMVDAISSLGSIDVQMDAWDLDVVLGASQKGLMAPPGLGLAALSERGWEAQRRCIQPRFYWDFARMRDRNATGSTPWTPPIPIYYALEASLELIMAEGLEAIYARHAAVAGSVRSGVEALGLDLYAEPEAASSTVTAVRVPDGVTPADLLDRLHRYEDVVVAGGLGPLSDEVFRIGHLGAVQPRDVRHCLAAIKRQLAGLGLRSRLEAGGALAFANP